MNKCISKLSDEVVESVTASLVILAPCKAFQNLSENGQLNYAKPHCWEIKTINLTHCATVSISAEKW